MRRCSREEGLVFRKCQDGEGLACVCAIAGSERKKVVLTRR